MRILLVSPGSTVSDTTPGWLRIPQLVLPLLSALTPPEHEVVAVEEERDRVPLEESWDLVGISTMTATALRAYQLAALFRQRGAKVVLGGIHPSVMPQEAARHADAVVVGEAEGVWEKVLHDARRNRLKPFYYNARPDLSRSPLPLRTRRRSRLGSPPYVMPIMASRGCPYDCEFCCVHRLYGRAPRHVPIERIVEDIERNRPSLIMFLDDNIGAVRSYALKLFEALRPLRIHWCGQASMRFILDDELYSAALRSGLGALFVGLESVEAQANRTMRKSLASIRLYEEAVRRCRTSGVILHASLIFGLDEQGPQVFEHTLDFLVRNAVPSVSPNLLTPYPGTALFDRLRREERILHTNWSWYDHSTVCYQPKDMSPEELTEKYLDFRSRFFSFASIFKRAPAQWRARPLVYLGMNLAFHGATARQRVRYRDYFRWLRNGGGGLSPDLDEPAPATAAMFPPAEEPAPVGPLPV